MHAGGLATDVLGDHAHLVGRDVQPIALRVLQQQVVALRARDGAAHHPHVPADAVRRLTAFPAENLGLTRRGRLKPGAFADVVVFDPATIQDHATFDKPHQYATGVRDVFVNGQQVLKNGEHTGARPGRVVRGRGWKGPR